MPNPNIRGTSRSVNVINAIDGDTLKVSIDGEEENLRLLALDTEESYAGSGKPVTPWGKKAKEVAREIFQEGSTVTIEFPGNESFEECLVKYRDNYDRLLTYAHTEDDEDFQEVMIRDGYSPYFTKYGYAEFEDHDRRYREAERQAQANGSGVWNQLSVNGTVMRDYDSLTAWWELRAQMVESFRRARREGVADLFDSRLDYETLIDREGEQTIVFTELRSYRRVGQNHVVVDIGSQSQPFKLFLPAATETPEGQQVLSLLDNRYIAESNGTTVESPLRSYAYISGEIKLYRDEPEIVVTSTDQVRDGPPSNAE